MGKYEPLTEHLRAQHVSCVQMSFSDIERVIGSKLPSSADTHRAWWSNNPSNNVMTRAWLEAGFETEQVDLPGRRLAFRRISTQTGFSESSTPAVWSAEPAGPSHKLALFGCLRGTVSLGRDVDLTEPADGQWGRELDREYPPSA